MLVILYLCAMYSTTRTVQSVYVCDSREYMYSNVGSYDIFAVPYEFVFSSRLAVALLLLFLTAPFYDGLL